MKLFINNIEKNLSFMEGIQLKSQTNSIDGQAQVEYKGIKYSFSIDGKNCKGLHRFALIIRLICNIAKGVFCANSYSKDIKDELSQVWNIKKETYIHLTTPFSPVVSSIVQAADRSLVSDKFKNKKNVRDSQDKEDLNNLCPPAPSHGQDEVESNLDNDINISTITEADVSEREDSIFKTSLDLLFSLEKNRCQEVLKKLETLGNNHHVDLNSSISEAMESPVVESMEERNVGFYTYDYLAEENINSKQLANAALRDIQQSRCRILQSKSLENFSEKDHLECEELRKKIPGWILLWKFADQFSEDELVSLRAKIEDFAETDVYVEKPLLVVDEIDNKWQGAPPELKQLAKKIAQEGLTEDNNKNVQDFLNTNKYEWFHSKKCTRSPDYSNAFNEFISNKQAPFDQRKYSNQNNYLSNDTSPYIHTDECLEEKKKQENILWFFKIFKSDRFNHFNDVRKTYGSQLFQCISKLKVDSPWLSTKEKIAALRDSGCVVPKPLIKAEMYHCTRSVDSVEAIIKSSIKILPALHEGAFTATYMEDDYGDYCFALKPSIKLFGLAQNISEYDDKNYYYAWFGSDTPIPITKKTLNCIILNDYSEERKLNSTELIVGARKIRYFLKKETGHYFPCYSGTIDNVLREKKKELGLVTVPKGWEKKVRLKTDTR